MKRFHVITLFPGEVRAWAEHSILGRAAKKRLLSIRAWNPRDFTKDKHRKTDDRPYGGGPGMVMYAEPILRAVEKAKGKKHATIVFLSPNGEPFNAALAQKWARGGKDLILIAGHYEGVDARVPKILRAKRVSLGPYVVTGGELPALTIIDAVSRFVPGVLGNPASVEETRLASPHVYTRPPALTWKKKTYRVPPVLLSGNHAAIARWRKKAREKHA